MNFLIQFIAFAFVLFAISRTILRLRDGRIKISEFIFWMIIWFSILTLVSIPDMIGNFSSKFLGITRPVDLGLYVSTVVLFYLLFRLYIKLETVEQEITKIVRELAINKKRK